VIVSVSELEVVWPLHRSHYLSVPEAGMVNMTAVDEPPSLIATPGRELAARALLAGPGMSQQRVSDLLGVSRRTIGRMAEADCTTALRDPQVLEGARTCLAETARRGSTAEERAAAGAWLEAAARDDHQVARAPAARRPAVPRSKAVPRPSRNGTPRNGSVTATAPHAPQAPPPLIQVEALRRQQQRILHRSALIAYVLTADQRSGGPLTMGDALAELLADITEAAHTIGTLLPTVTGRPETARPAAAGARRRP
jgi:hypothetical protein